MERGLTWGGEHTIQCTDDVLWKCTPESCIILLISVTPPFSQKAKKALGRQQHFGAVMQSGGPPTWLILPFSPKQNPQKARFQEGWEQERVKMHLVYLCKTSKTNNL